MKHFKRLIQWLKLSYQYPSHKVRIKWTKGSGVKNITLIPRGR